MTDVCNETSVPEKFWDQDSYFNGDPVLSEGVGYVVLLLFGGAFSLLTSIAVMLDAKYNKTTMSSENFNTAGRTVKTGLTASVIVSQWTWAATLLQSSNVAYQYGVSGPFWYASGATIQVLLFGIIAIELKSKAPTCHTFLEIILARWGYTAHKVFLFFALLTNTIVTSMLLLGGAATVNALTGVDLNLASFLIPWGVILYTMHGGLKATFMCSYTHTAVIFAALLIFVFSIYAGDEKFVGSPGRMYDMLKEVSEIKNCCYGPNEYTLNACGRVKGNEDGSYLTMMSREGLIFGIINVVGNFGTVFVDQSYWQAAIAAKPQCSHKGYLVGGICWFTIPFALATSLGLGVIAMQLPVTGDEAGAGLVPPAAALEILGDSGAILILTMLFMAITSTGSAELIAVSSLMCYDVYRTYIKPSATGDDILRVGRYFILGFGLVMGVLAIVLNEIGLNLGWVYLFMGVLIGSAVLPVAFTLLWSGATAKGAITGAIVGMVCGVIAWLVTCTQTEGAINVTNLGANYPMLAGNVTSILSSGFICWVLSRGNPQNYDWEGTKQIAMIGESLENSEWYNNDYSAENLLHAKRWVMRWGLGFTLLIVLVWPLMSLPAGVFTESYFNFWIGLSMIWGICATIVVFFLPLYESRVEILTVIFGMMGAGPYVSKVDQIADLEARVTQLEMAAGTIDKVGGINRTKTLDSSSYPDEIAAPAAV